MDWQDIEAKTRNTVVQILVQRTIFNWFEPYKAPEQVEQIGSAFFINNRGDLLTNWHVIEQAKSIYVFIPVLGRRFIQASVIGACPESDVALLGITPEGRELIQSLLHSIPFLPLGNSDAINRAEPVLALGYPLGQHYLKSTIGVISGRDYLDEQAVIQVTAPLNFGSSGGPLLDIYGEVIGINTMMVPATQNIAYIIPINEIKILLKDLYKHRILRKTMLGLRGNHATNELAQFLGNPVPPGLYIAYVFPYSIADRASVKPGDMLYEVNGYIIDAFGETKVEWCYDKVPLLELFNRFSRGDELEFIVYRRGKRKKLRTICEEMPIYPIHIGYPDYETIEYETIGGMVLMELRQNHLDLLPITNDLIDQYRYFDKCYEQLILITHMVPGSVIDKVECLGAGDLVSHINNSEVHTISDIRHALKKSIQTGYVCIKTYDDFFAVLSLKEILKDELRLVNDFMYPLSTTVQKLMVHYLRTNKV